MAGSVYLLGSGFSRAISEHMPTMDGLSVAIRNDLSARGLPALPGQDTPLADNFEQWLSYLVEEPPWLAEGQTYRNRGAFSDVAESLHSVLSALQLQVTTDAPPAWLATLVRHWQAVGSTVITFNYDLLVEKSWLALERGHGWGDLYPVAIAPIGSRVAAVWGSEGNKGGLRLLKLHGSLNWRYSGPSSPPGDQVFDVGYAPWDGSGIPRTDDSEELSADKVPMIVPPAAVKSPYYVNNTIRAMWRQAAEALREADELVIIGFSLPPSDQIVRSMLATELNTDATIIPVDYGDAIVDNLQRIFPADRIITDYAGLGVSSVPNWVASAANLAD
ncbi:SIR2 family protein [Amycolatopsis solani]|uniref:SIR2 family protein n=1 Tax=Amycolatopsis solani TaxID=3028615 RepID=UPI0025AFF28E|nr:SIR2 family protein [Amycolatopsis sp. MEP2-6]